MPTKQVSHDLGNRLSSTFAVVKAMVEWVVENDRSFRATQCMVDQSRPF